MASAPKLKPHTGWKPWPRPIRAELMDIIYLVTMDIAAMAASPKRLAATFQAAASEIPMRRPRMNTGSRIMFKIPPVVIPAMA